MRVRLAVFMLLVFLPLSISSFATAEMTSTNYSISTTVISGGGGLIGSATYNFHGTIGQPSPLMETLARPVSDSYNLYPGFWCAVGICEGVSSDDSDGDGIGDHIEIPGCTDHQDVDSDGDGLRDGIEDADHDGIVDSGESDPCDEDSDNDGLADGEEDANQNGVRDPGETDSLDDDSDNDGHKDGKEKSVGTNPLNRNSWPWVICIGDCDSVCDECAEDVTDAMTLVSESATINYLKIRNVNVRESGATIPKKILVGVESGEVIFQP